MHRFVVALALVSSTALAQAPGSCSPGRASGTLDIGEVEATVYTTGLLFYGREGVEQYVVPKSMGIPPIFNASLWIGGTVGGGLRVSGTTYGQGGLNSDFFEFWPGPLDAGATLPDPTDCSAYDRIWVVSVKDIHEYERGGAMSRDLAEWPVGLGAPAVDVGGVPIVPTSRDQTLHLVAGERPDLLGQQSAFWVLNDVGNVHRSFESAPLGIEVRVLAGAFLDPQSPTLTRSTAYRFEIVNRSDATIDDLRASLFVGWQLGNGSDDYIGSDSTRSLSFVYNADNNDDGSYGYGEAPPALGIDMLSGASSSMYYIGGDANRNNPHDAIEADRVMQGIWRGGTPLKRMGNGYNQGGERTLWAYSGRAEYAEFWSETDAFPAESAQPTRPSQRDAQFTSPPVTLAPGAAHAVGVMMLYARGSTNYRSLENLRGASDFVQRRYEDGRLFPALRAPVASEDVPESDGLRLSVRPNPVARRLTVSYSLASSTPIRLAVLDVLGREVELLDDGLRPAGRQESNLDVSGLAVGVYAVVLQSEGVRVARTFTVTR